MMQVLLVGVGNPLRRDDGIAHRVLEILDLEVGSVVRKSEVHQLTPEMAEEFSRHDAVIVVDADVEPGEAFLEEVSAGGCASALGHQLGAAEVAALARALYGWTGACLVCHVPGADFGEGGGFSDEAEGNAWRAAHLIEQWLEGSAS